MNQLNAKDITTLAIMLGVVSASSGQANELGNDSKATANTFMVAQANSTDKSGGNAACGKGSCGTDEKGAKKHKHNHKHGRKERQEKRAERKARRQAKEHIGAPNGTPAQSPAPAPQQ